MSSPTIIEESSVPMFVVKETLQANQKVGELNFRANKTLEYLNQVHVVKKKEGEKLIAEITKLEIPRMKESIVHKLVDVKPTTMEELKSVLSGYTITVSKENLDKLFEALNKT